MTVKLNVKLGQLEFNYEGSEDFLKTELSNILHILSQTKLVGGLAENGSSFSTDSKPPADSAPKGNIPIQMTTGSIAAKLSCSSGPDLIIAACAHLLFVLGNETFNRKQILEEMKNASGYYKSSYSGNLSKYIAQLVKASKLIERSRGQYSLHATLRTQLEVQLAQ